MKGILIGLAAAALAAVIAAFSEKFVARVIKPPRESAEDAEHMEIARGNLAPGELSSYALEPGELRSDDGTKLCWYLLPCGCRTERAVVLAHGYRSRHEHMLKYARLYTGRGYDVLLFDQRNCGGSGGALTTMAYLEWRDLDRMVRFARERYAVVGTHGESMGGAAAVMQACLGTHPDFAVEDCGYADLAVQMRYDMRRLAHLPRFPFLPICSMATRLRAGFFYRDVSPVKELRRHGGLAQVPMLFVHGGDDRSVPRASAEKLYEAKKGTRALYICKGARHTRSVSDDPAEYRRRLYAFLDECGL